MQTRKITSILFFQQREQRARPSAADAAANHVPRLNSDNAQHHFKTILPRPGTARATRTVPIITQQSLTTPNSLTLLLPHHASTILV